MLVIFGFDYNIFYIYMKILQIIFCFQKGKNMKGVFFPVQVLFLSQLIQQVQVAKSAGDPWCLVLVSNIRGHML